MYTIESRVRYSEVDSERRLTLSALMDAPQDCCAFQSEELGIGVDYLARNRRVGSVFVADRDFAVSEDVGRDNHWHMAV